VEESTIYNVFIDFKTSFDSHHRESLWKMLRHYGTSGWWSMS